MEKNTRGKFRKSFGPKADTEFEQKIIDLARVTRVMAGGKRMRFRACVAIGDKRGRVGFGLAKGADVTLAVNKAATKARKNLLTIPLVRETIPHEIRFKFKAARLLLKPAPKGTGIKAGGAMRVLLELAGVPNVVGKMLGTGNKITNVQAFLRAMSLFKPEATREKKELGTEAKKEANEVKK